LRSELASERLKIVITVENFDPAKGYLEYYLARELECLGQEVVVVTYSSEGFERYRLDEGFEVVRLPYLVKIHGIHVPTPSSIVYLLGLYLKERPDVLHCQPLFSVTALFSVLIRKSDRPAILGSVITSSPERENGPKGVHKGLLYFCARGITRFAQTRWSRVIAIGHDLAEKSRDLFDLKKVRLRVIPLGADPNLFDFRQEARERMRKHVGIDQHELVLVYTGKLYPRKGVHHLIRASSRIIHRKPWVRVLILGRGKTDYEDCLRRLVLQLGIKSNVIFHEWVHRTELPSIYSSADIAVWPGTPSISIVEAAATKLPVVIEDPIAIYSIQHGNGYRFPSDDVDTLEEILEELAYDDKRRKKMGSLGRQLVRTKLNWKWIAKRYLSLYRIVVREWKM
jgi:glycosyltransferase involved in cell wall biosynthesis